MAIKGSKAALICIRRVMPLGPPVGPSVPGSSLSPAVKFC
jgi:hypothetical protein